MRARSFAATLACAAVLAVAGAGTAVADGGTPTATPSPGPTTSAAPGRTPAATPTPAPTRDTHAGSPTATPRPVPGNSRGKQVGTVPSGAPDTGVPVPASGSNTAETAALAAGGVLVLGAGALVMRRRIQGRG